MDRGLRPGACVLTLAVTLIALLLAGCTSGSATPHAITATTDVGAIVIAPSL